MLGVMDEEAGEGGRLWTAGGVATAMVMQVSRRVIWFHVLFEARRR